MEPGLGLYGPDVATIVGVGDARKVHGPWQSALIGGGAAAASLVT